MAMHIINCYTTREVMKWFVYYHKGIKENGLPKTIRRMEAYSSPSPYASRSDIKFYTLRCAVAHCLGLFKTLLDRSEQLEMTSIHFEMKDFLLLVSVSYENAADEGYFFKFKYES